MNEPFGSDRLWKRNIAEGSTRLLNALWRAHPDIMRALGAQRPQ